jgi:hypothetical protein
MLSGVDRVQQAAPGGNVAVLHGGVSLAELAELS